MIRAILFDCWGTLFYDDVEPKPIPEIARILGYSWDDYHYIKIFERNFMLYPVKDVDKAIRKLLEELGKMNEQLFTKVKQLYNQLGRHARPFDDVPPILQQLKGKGYKLCLLSNTDPGGFERLKEKWRDMLKLFDVLVLSYEMHELKPSPVMFSKALEKLQVKPQEAMMIGDSLKDDVLAAEKCGIKGLLIDRKNKHINYPNRITSLVEMWKFL